LLPRWDGVALRPPGTMADKAKLAEQAKQIRDAMEPFEG
jgi:histidine triad (HIT) family protein